jgi:alpha-N-arabinofuranosidase
MSLSLTEIKISTPAEKKGIPPYLFGNFMEQLGYSSDGGVLAQALSNPTLERDSFLKEEQVEYYLRAGKILTDFFLHNCDPAVIPDDFLICRDSSGFGVAALDDCQSQGMPFPWAPLGPEGKATKAVGRIGGGIRLRSVEGFAPVRPGDQVLMDNGPAGMRQGIFLPFQRCLDYHGHAWVRVFSNSASASGRIEFGLRRRMEKAHPAGKCLAVDVQQIQGCEWQKIGFHIRLPEGQVGQSEPVDFYLRWLSNGSEDLLVDQVMLIPDDAIDGIFDPDVVRLCREYKPTLLRWPGGNFVSHYHWRDGVGSIDRRPTRRNLAWGGLETNFFGTDEFLRFCELVGADAHITVNTGTGSPDEAAAWVEYCNGSSATRNGALRDRNGHTSPYHVKIWEVGNETYGAWQGGYHGAEENAERFLEFAPAMREVDPEIELIATGNPNDVAEPDPRFDFMHADQRWNRMLFETASADMDYLSLHSLPNNDSFKNPVSPVEAYYACMAQPIHWERTFLPELERLAKAHPNRKGQPARIAITEWGILGSLQHLPEVRNFGGVPYAGVFLNSVIRASEFVGITQATALLHGGAVHKAAGWVWYDPQCLVIRKYADLAGGERLEAVIAGPCYDAPEAPDLSRPIEAVSYVDVSAAVLPDGAEVICLANVACDQDAPVEISIDAQALANIRWESLSYPDFGAIAKPGADQRFQITSGSPEVTGARIKCTLPACSVNWLYYHRK